MPNLTITKTNPAGMTHTPAGSPVNVPDGGTVTVRNNRRRPVRFRIRVGDEVTFDQVIPPGGTIPLTVGSQELPDGNYDVIDPPALLRFVGRPGASFRFK